MTPTTAPAAGQETTAIPDLRAHQIGARDAALAALSEGGTALVTMATGTGKTRVGLAVAESLALFPILILVPTLALADQTVAVWRAQARFTHSVAWRTVCSGEEEPARSRDPHTVAGWLSSSQATVIVATYHSSPVIAEAQRAARVPFSLVVADEAHHLAGPPPGPFGTLVRGEIAAERRLLLTATPRTWVRRDRDVARVGLDDEATYGPRVYDLGLGMAIEAGLLADYRVVMATVAQSELAPLARRLGREAPADVLAAAVAVCRVMAQLQLRRVVSFHSRVERARRFAALMAAAAAQLPPDQRPAGPGFTTVLDGRTDGATRRLTLERLADPGPGWALAANCRVLGEGVDVPSLDAVALCDPRASLGDVAQAVGRALRNHPGKELGTVILPIVVDEEGTPLENRGLEVASAALRALRAHDERLADALSAARRTKARRAPATAREADVSPLADRLEVHLPPGASAFVAQRLMISVVDGATESFDEWFGLLEDWVQAHGTAAVPRKEVVVAADGTRRALGSWCSICRARRRQRRMPVELEAALEALPGWEWEPLDASFTRQISALERWAAHSGLPVGQCPAKARYDGVKVGQFVNVVRNLYRNGSLSPERIAPLEALDGWCWNLRDAVWEEKYSHLLDFVASHGHARPSSAAAGYEGLGRWVTKQRGALRAGRLDPERSARLRALPGWVDHERDAAWQTGYETLLDFVVTHDRLPSSDERHGGMALGSWVMKQRNRRPREPERIRALEAVPHWEWPQTLAGRAQAAEDALKAFVAAHGHARVPFSHVDDQGLALGTWVLAQRRLYRLGRLDPERAARLAALPGWVWEAAVGRPVRTSTAAPTTARSGRKATATGTKRTAKTSSRKTSTGTTSSSKTSAAKTSSSKTRSSKTGI